MNLIKNKVLEDSVLSSQLTNEDVGIILRHLLDPTHYAKPKDKGLCMLTEVIQKDIARAEEYRANERLRKRNTPSSPTDSKESAESSGIPPSHTPTPAHTHAPTQPQAQAQTPTQSKKIKSFKKPTIDEIRAFCKEKKLTLDAEQFYGYYEANGWHVGKCPMHSWKGAIMYWWKNQKAISSHNIQASTVLKQEGYVFKD